MPLAAVVTTSYGTIFACHGGLSPLWRTLDDIHKINRFVEPEDDPALLDILWSDPVDDYDFEHMTDADYQDFVGIDFRPNPARGCSHRYGFKAVKDFLDTNRLVCIVRAHEVQEDGFKKHFDPAVMELRMKDMLRRRSATKRPDADANNPPAVTASSSAGAQTDLPPVVTIFSAPNYCDRYENKAAILRIDMALEAFRVIQYDCVPHPETPEGGAGSQMEVHFQAIIQTCPYMPTSLSVFVRLAVDLGAESDLAEDGWHDAADGAGAEPPAAPLPAPAVAATSSSRPVSPLSSCGSVDSGGPVDGDVPSTPVRLTAFSSILQVRPI
jgi:diadenosine tetraphosphatase ApaH/serine/threonine PP2A family protein phosphatase